MFLNNLDHTCYTLADVFFVFSVCLVKPNSASVALCKQLCTDTVFAYSQTSLYNRRQIPRFWPYHWAFYLHPPNALHLVVSQFSNLICDEVWY